MDVASPVRATASPEPAPVERSRPLLRWSVHAAWVVLLALATELRVGRFGFHPSDQGFILAQAWRVLHGEVPHAEIISARPLGSAVLHVADFALPMPLFFGSSFLSMIEIIVATIGFAALVTRRRVLAWGPGMTAMVAAASLINLNAFPLMAWHTVDGIALTACGAWALDAGLRGGHAFARRGGLALLGCAVFVKQSFALAAVIGVCWLLLHPATRAYCAADGALVASPGRRPAVPRRARAGLRGLGEPGRRVRGDGRAAHRRRARVRPAAARAVAGGPGGADPGAGAGAELLRRDRRGAARGPAAGRPARRGQAGWRPGCWCW